MLSSSPDYFEVELNKLIEDMYVKKVSYEDYLIKFRFLVIKYLGINTWTNE